MTTSSSTRTLVDSHVHLWDRSRFDYAWLATESGALGRDFLPADLLGEVAHPHVDFAGAVFVQADCRADQALAEAAWVSGLADAGAPIIGIVAAAQLETGDTDGLAALSNIPRVVGVRRLLQDEKPGFAVQDEFVAGVRSLAGYGFTMDLCIRQWQLPEATALVEACPEVAFVLDHLGKPTISSDAFAGWAEDLAALAHLPNVHCKLSGLMTEAPDDMRTPATLRRWLDHAVEVFGAERCMFGSDWPVLTLAGSYRWWVDLVLELVDDLSPAESLRVLNGTALATYDPLKRAVLVRES